MSNPNVQPAELVLGLGEMVVGGALEVTAVAILPGPHSVLVAIGGVASFGEGWRHLRHSGYFNEPQYMPVQP
jgi:hypothetical protein